MTNSHQNGLSLRLGRLPVRVEWSFFLVAVLLGLALEDPVLIAAWVGVLGGSILVHELGHAVAFHLCGVRSRVVIHAFGGVTIPEGPVASRARRIGVSLAGPLTGLVLLGLPALVLDQRADPTSWVADVAWFLVWVNVAWSLVNLLPVLPLDGGHVADELLTAGFGDRGRVASRVLSIVVAGVLGLWAFRSGLLFAGLLALWLASDSVRWLRDRKSAGAVDTLRAAARSLAAGDPVRARALAARVPSRESHGLGDLAREVEAWAALAAGDEAAATALAEGLGTRATGHLRAALVEADRAEALNLTVDAWLHGAPVPSVAYVDRLEARGLVDEVVDRLLASRADGAGGARARAQELLCRAGRFPAAVRLGEGALALGPDAGVAYNTACALARTGWVDEALARLGEAIDGGAADPTLLDRDPDLAALRGDPRFAALRARLPIS